MGVSHEKSIVSLLASNPVPAGEQLRQAAFCQMHVTEPKAISLTRF
jgi:hypothetical protein